MPHVQISYQEAEGRLPNVCLRCGQPAVCRVSKAIRLHDTASGYSRGPIGFLTMLFDFGRHLSSPTVMLRGPFCETHRNHWAFRRTIIWAMIALIPVLLVGVLLLYLAGALAPGTARFLTFLVAFIGILSAAIVYGTSTIKLSSNSANETFVLAHVHPRFIEALERQREEHPNEVAAEDRPARRTQPRRI